MSMPLDTRMLLVIMAVIFIVLLLMSMGITRIIRQVSTRRKMIDKIRSGGYDSNYDDQDDTAVPGSLSQKRTLSLFRKIGTRVSTESSAGYSAARIRFLRAGFSVENAGAVLWGAKVFFGFCFSAVFIFLKLTVIQTLDTQMSMGIGIVTAIFGLYLPDLWLHIKEDRRKEAIMKSLPDALDLLLVCVEAGMAIDSAFNRVAKEMAFSDPELSREFVLLNLELRAGKMRRDALKNLALRTNLDDVNNFVTLLIQADKFGTSIGTSLRVYADSFRVKRFQKAEELAAKIPVKILIPLTFFIFPALFVVLLGPAAISIYRSIIMR